MVLKAALLFILAGIAEIGGGYLIWQWLREGKTWYVGLCGGVILAVYGIIATFQVFLLWACICSIRRCLYCSFHCMGLVD